MVIELNNFKYNKGFEKQSVKFPTECHKTHSHVISVSFQLNKIILQDEILVIIIDEN